MILTTMTTVAALMPMAFGLLGSSKSYGPFAAAIAFGLLFAMFGTLFVIPLSYATLSKTEERGRQLITAWRSRRKPADVGSSLQPNELNRPLTPVDRKGNSADHARLQHRRVVSHRRARLGRMACAKRLGKHDRFFRRRPKASLVASRTSIVATTFAADTPLAIAGLVATEGVAGNWFWWADVLPVS